MHQMTVNSALLRKPDKILLGGLAFLTAPLILLGFFYIATSDGISNLPFIFILPWAILLGILVLAPVFYYVLFARSDLVNPIMLASVTYFFPAFVIGSIALAFGWTEPYYLSYVKDIHYNFPLTLALIAIGFSSLMAGYYLPISKRLGIAIGGKSSSVEIPPQRYLIPGVILVIAGFLFMVLATLVGNFGFQFKNEWGIFDTAIAMLPNYLTEGIFIVSLAFFRTKKLTVLFYLSYFLVLIAIVAKALLSGGRSGFLAFVILTGVAFILSERKIKLKTFFIGGIFSLVALVGGMLYGTKFREIKSTRSSVSFNQYVGYIGETFDALAKQNGIESLGESFLLIAERFDTVSSLAVVVSNHEELAPFEEAYGLDNNILKDTAGFFIPRVFWPDKPVASDPSAYSDLYFDYGENAFSITPIGDLLRNFGIPGIVLGMLILGVLLRVIYASTIENRPFNISRATVYFMLVSAVSYEGFYGTLLPVLIRVFLLIIIGIAFVEAFVKFTDRRKTVY
ncbi:MAG TPA: O-antigen polymerase [Pyrinomonadaceae bacterium]|nr:O-antigen polymerase [Pyrinomonadaceae bacterium]